MQDYQINHSSFTSNLKQMYHIGNPAFGSLDIEGLICPINEEAGGIPDEPVTALLCLNPEIPLDLN